MTRQEQSAARHAALRRQFLAIIGEQGRTLSDAEAAILDAFLASDHHFAVTDLFARARDTHPAITEEMATEILFLLCEYKIAHEIVLDGRTFYEHFHLNAHHDHFVCVMCGVIGNFYDPQIENLQEANALKAGFRPLIHRLEIYGVCADCIARKGEVHPLSECLTGEMVRVVRLQGDANGRRRLTDMGIVPDAAIRVLGMNHETRSAMIAVDQTRFAISGDITRKVFVTMIEPLQDKMLSSTPSLGDQTLFGIDKGPPQHGDTAEPAKTGAQPSDRKAPAMNQRSNSPHSSLFDLAPGQKGRILRIRTESSLRKRLLEMGFVPGTIVEKVKLAPLADPAEYLIKGYHVSLRSEEARDILMEDGTEQ